MDIKYHLRIAFFLLLLPVAVSGQISQGGVPMQVLKQKSVFSGVEDLVVMPAVDGLKMRRADSRSGPDMLKPFKFAHSFEVSLSPQNSGKWYNTSEVNIWQLRIRSTGAFSLNLILNNFRLPENARLFLISLSTGEIKGAYTSQNNSDNQILAIEPVAGDEMLVQYEEPVKVAFPGEFTISRVAHDFVGITASGGHRPLGISGSCNINVNCNEFDGTEELRDAVCRLIVNGTEICTATLINNTSQDGTPYVLTAYHCLFDATRQKTMEEMAQVSVYLFNYESPSCSSVDGDVSRSLSGSTLKASFDSLDFALLRLNTSLPYHYRPYLAGWNRQGVPPASSACIHHPLGDIKKIAVDKDAAVTSTFNSGYLAKGFWNIRRWERGVTEDGSSGGPLFDQDKLLVGTLTGGSATCSLPTNDYFEKFSLAWDYRKEPDKQLKVWLDPLNLNVEKLAGLMPNSGETLCKPITNIKDHETFSSAPVTGESASKGYWSGTNELGFTEFAEKFRFSKNCLVQGVSLGVAKLKTSSLYSNSFVTIKVYEGKDKPVKLLYNEKYSIRNLSSDAMNYFRFKEPVRTSGNFFVSYDISQMRDGDTLAVYMADRKQDVSNSFLLKNQSGWSAYSSQNPDGNGSALLMELIACGVEYRLINDEFDSESEFARFFPNPLPAGSVLNILAADSIDCPEDVAVYDLLGKRHRVPFSQEGPNSMSLDFRSQRPGIYFVRLEVGGRPVVGKIAYIP